MADVSIKDWTPTREALPPLAYGSVMYLLPTRHQAGGERPQTLMYVEAVRYLPKFARAGGIPLEFSVSAPDRAFLSEYSADVETIAYAIASIGWISDWTIALVQLAVAEARARLGYAKEDPSPRLRVAIAEIDNERNVLRGVEVEGDPAAVIAALTKLRDS